MSSVPPSPNSRIPGNHNNNPQQISQSELASRAAASPPPPRRPRRLTTLESSSSSSPSTGADIHHHDTGATTKLVLPAIAVAPIAPGPFPDRRPMASLTEEYQAQMREWHNRIGKKYRNKLNGKFEGLQAVLIHVTSNVDMSLHDPVSTGSGSPRRVDEGCVARWDRSAGSGGMVAYTEEVLRKIQQEEEYLDDHELYDDDDDDEGAEDEDDDDAEGPSARSGATRRPRRRRTKGINKAGVLAMARKTIIKLEMERDQLLRELAEAGDE